MTPNEALAKRSLPPLRTREEMKAILQKEVYGYLPDVPYQISVTDEETLEGRYGYGTVLHTAVSMTVRVGSGAHTFPVHRLLHTDGKKRPLVVFLCFRHHSPYFPTEELSEYEADFLMLCYKDVSSDDGDFSTGLAPWLLPRGQETDETCGKIGIWAWAAMRVLDYGLTLDGTDPQNVAIAGHSRLGKTALFAAMTDERFRFAFSNAAGCAGDALAHGGPAQENLPEGGRAEQISDIVSRFPYWFCKNYQKYAKANISDSFDQHFLLASIAPRCVAVGSCDGDAWADPASQQLCALAAGQAWETQGVCGFVGDDRFLQAGEACLDGHVGYFMIHSLHFLSRHSWRRFMEFLFKHKIEGDTKQ